MKFLAQALMSQANIGEVDPDNPIRRMNATRVREFFRINSQEFHGSKVDEDANVFVDDMYKVLLIMRGCSIEKDEFTVFQLEDVSQLWYEH